MTAMQVSHADSWSAKTLFGNVIVKILQQNLNFSWFYTEMSSAAGKINTDTCQHASRRGWVGEGEVDRTVFSQYLQNEGRYRSDIFSILSSINLTPCLNFQENPLKRVFLISVLLTCFTILEKVQMHQSC